NSRHQLIERPGLRVAARQRRNGGHKKAFSVTLNNDIELVGHDRLLGVILRQVQGGKKLGANVDIRIPSRSVTGYAVTRGPSRPPLPQYPPKLIAAPKLGLTISSQTPRAYRACSRNNSAKRPGSATSPAGILTATTAWPVFGSRPNTPRTPPLVYWFIASKS